MKTSRSQRIFRVAVSAIVVIALLVVIAYVAYVATSRHTYKDLSNLLRGQLQSRDSLLHNEFAQAERQIRFLASVPPVIGIMRAARHQGMDPIDGNTTEVWKQRLQSIFRGFVESNPNVIQVRYIGVADKGFELVRVNGKLGKAELVPESQLQSKDQRDYFREALKLDAGAVYFSPINLNRERGELDPNHQPTYRVATPIRDARGNLFGVIVINYDAPLLFQKLLQDLPEFVQLYLTNNQDEYLVHPFSNKTFAFDYGESFRWMDEFPQQERRVSYLPDELAHYNHRDGGILAIETALHDSQGLNYPRLRIRLAVPYAHVREQILSSVLVTVLSALVAMLLVVALLVSTIQSLRARQKTQQMAEAKTREMNELLQQRVKEATEEANQYMAFKQAILDSGGHAIIATDTEGTITLFNPAAQWMLGYEAEEMIGKFTPQVFHLPEEVEARARQFSEQLGETIEPGFEVFVAKTKRGLPNVHEWTYVRRDESRVPVYLSVTALRDKSGEILGYIGMASDISQQVQNRNSLEAARDHLIKASEMAALGVWNWDLRDDRLVWNREMMEMYQIPPEKIREGLYYQHWYDSIHPDDRDWVVSKLEGALAGSDWFDPTFRIIRPDGQVRIIQAGAVVEYDENDQPTMMLGISQDITDQQHYEQELREAKEAAEAASLSKSEFLANMSHEIRTPMNGVLGITELLRRTKLDQRQQDYLNLIHNSADSLLSILNDILDLSKIEAGKIDLEATAFCLDQKVGDVMKGFAPVAHDKGLDVHYYISPDLPDWVLADPVRIGQVVFNLVGNAIKFTEHGEVSVELLLDQTEAKSTFKPGDEIHALLNVRDTGIGIPKEKQELIFKPFSQADSSTTRRFGGTGLGLNIVSQLITLMKGKIRLESEPGRGTLIQVSLPLRVAEPVLSRKQKDSPWLQDKQLFQQLNCLAVDDNATNRRWLKDMLESWGCKPLLADSVSSAIALLRQAEADSKTFDILLLDKNMPDKDGFTLLEQMDRLALSRPGVILMLSSSDGEQDYARCKELAIAQYLVKPVKQSEIFNSIVTVLKQGSQAGGSHGSDNGALANHRYDDELTSVPQRILVAEDNPINQRLVEDLLKDRGHQVVMVENGEDAVQAVLEARRSGERFDLILMDVQMPKMDGLEASRTIRHNQEGQPDIRIIGLTANALKGDREICLAAGMDDYLSKPIDPDVLLERIELPVRYHETDSETSSTVHYDAVFDHEKAFRMVRNKMNLLLKIIEVAVPMIDESLVKMEHAEKHQDARQIAELAHKLKGSLGNLAHDQLIEALVRLERESANGNLNFFEHSWTPLKAKLQRLNEELRSFLRINNAS